MSVVVYGSANRDLVYRVPQIPGPGQTVLVTSREQHLGGKGNNQAIAAARADAAVCFITALGNDGPAGMVTDGLIGSGVDPLVRWMDDRTGSAMIMVDPTGENSIVVDPGAYAQLGGLNSDELVALEKADLLLMQLEIPIPAVCDAARNAGNRGTTVVLNAAPMITFPSELLQAVDLLIVNETEARQLSGADRPGAHDLLSIAPAAIMTLGSRGALVGVRGEGTSTVDAWQVDVTDTTGAGDTFCGALVAELDRRASGSVTDLNNLVTATEFATAAAALSVQQSGAVESIPERADVVALLHSV